MFGEKQLFSSFKCAGVVETRLLGSNYRDGEGRQIEYSPGTSASKFPAFLRRAAGFADRHLDAVGRAVVAGLQTDRIAGAAWAGELRGADSDFHFVSDRGLRGGPAEPAPGGDCDAVGLDGAGADTGGADADEPDSDLGIVCAGGAAGGGERFRYSGAAIVSGGDGGAGRPDECHRSEL